MFVCVCWCGRFVRFWFGFYHKELLLITRVFCAPCANINAHARERASSSSPATREEKQKCERSLWLSPKWDNGKELRSAIHLTRGRKIRISSDSVVGSSQCRKARHNDDFGLYTLLCRLHRCRLFVHVCFIFWSVVDLLIAQWMKSPTKVLLLFKLIHIMDDHKLKPFNKQKSRDECPLGCYLAQDFSFLCLFFSFSSSSSSCSHSAVSWHQILFFLICKMRITKNHGNRPSNAPHRKTLYTSFQFQIFLLHNFFLLAFRCRIVKKHKKITPNWSSSMMINPMRREEKNFIPEANTWWD